MLEKLKNFGVKKIIAILVIIALVIAIIIGLVVKSQQDNKVVREGTIETIETRTIANSISGTGVVNSITSEDVIYEGGTTSILSSGGTAKAKKVYVAVGDVVSAGTTICQIDTSDLEDTLEDQQDTLADLQEQLADANENKWNARVDQNEQDADYDEQIKENQQDRYETGTKAVNNYTDAANNYNDAKSKYEDAVAKRDAQRENLIKTTYKDWFDSAGNLLSEHTQAELDFRISQDAQYAYYNTQANTYKSQMSTYETQMNTYKDQVDELKKQDDQDLIDAKADYDESVDDRVETYDDQIEELEDQIADQEETIADTQQSIADCTVKCTVDGTVTELNVQENRAVNSSTVAVIECADTFIIEAQIDEYDISDVKVGMKALVKTDATRDEELEGEVTNIAPRATGTSSSDSSSSSLTSGFDLSSLTGMSTGSSSGGSSATFLVKIGNLEKNDRMMLGMNAKVSILTEEETDALSVPFDALQTDENGNIYIEIVTKGDSPEDEDFTTEKVFVKTGIEGSYYVEITSDKVKEGDKVFIPTSNDGSSLDDLLDNMGADAGA